MAHLPRYGLLTVARLSAAPIMTTPRCSPADPIDIEHVAQSLVDAGLAKTYDEARADLEAAREAVAAEFVGGLRRAIGDPLPLPPSTR